jgi:hypothetical protein
MSGRIVIVACTGGSKALFAARPSGASVRPLPGHHLLDRASTAGTVRVLPDGFARTPPT